MERFLEYLSEVDPQWIAEFRGADPVRIALLESLVGLPFPRSYRSFLELMGKDNAGLNVTVDGLTDVDSLIDFYTGFQEGREGVAWLYAPEVIVIGIESRFVHELGLRCSGGGEPPVVEPGRLSVQEDYAESLEKLLCQLVFPGRAPRTNQPNVSCLMPHGRRRTEYLLPHARAIASELGLVAFDFSDASTVCGEIAGASVRMGQRLRDGIGLQVGITAPRKDLCAEIGSVFVRKLGMEMSSSP